MNHTNANQVVLKQFSDFASASTEAKWVARRYRETVLVRRAGNGWEVVVSELLAARLNWAGDEAAVLRMAEVQDDLDYYEDDPDFRPALKQPPKKEAQDYPEEEEQDYYLEDEPDYCLDKDEQQLWDDLASDADDYSRSEEDGWFYSDDDQ